MRVCVKLAPTPWHWASQQWTLWITASVRETLFQVTKPGVRKLTEQANRNILNWKQKTEALQNTPTGPQQRESGTSHSTRSSGVNASPPNTVHHWGQKSKCAKTTTHQTPVYLPPDTDADGQRGQVHLSESNSDEYQVSPPHSETAPATEIDEAALHCQEESAAQHPVQPWNHGSGNNGAKTVRIWTCSGSQDVAIPLWTTGSGVIITPVIPVQSKTFLSSTLIRYSFSLGDPNTLTESVIRSSSWLSERSPSGRPTVWHGINSRRNTVRGIEGEILSILRTLIFRYTQFVDPLPNPIALTSEVYRLWNTAKDEIGDAGNIERSEKSIHIVSMVSYHQIYDLVLTTSDRSKTHRRAHSICISYYKQQPRSIQTTGWPDDYCSYGPSPPRRWSVDVPPFRIRGLYLRDDTIYTSSLHNWLWTWHRQ